MTTIDGDFSQLEKIIEESFLARDLSRKYLIWSIGLTSLALLILVGCSVFGENLDLVDVLSLAILGHLALGGSFVLTILCRKQMGTFEGKTREAALEVQRLGKLISLRP